MRRSAPPGLALALASVVLSTLGCASSLRYELGEPGDGPEGSTVVYELLEPGDEVAGPRSPPDEAPIVVRAVGDIMLGTTYPYPDGRELPPPQPHPAGIMAPMAELLGGADLAFGNLEGVFARPDQPGTRPKCPGEQKGCFAFRMPPEYGDWLVAAGFDLLSIANNHILDFGEGARASTRERLDALGLAWSGPSGSVARREVRGKRVSMLAFSVYDHSQDLNRLDEARAIIAAEAARCDILIVSMHAGGEGPDYLHVAPGAEYFLGRNRGNLRVFARAAVAAGADLVLGHGPHVPRALELIDGRLVAYSLGNFATWRRFNLTGPNGIAFVLEVAMDGQGAFVAGRVHPIRQREPGGPVPDPEAAVVPMLQRLSREDFPETGVQVLDDGTILAPGALIAGVAGTTLASIAAPPLGANAPVETPVAPSGPKGAKVLEPLHPHVRKLALELHARAAAEGLAFRFVHGHARYEKRSRPGPGGMANWHQFGLAFDILLEGRRDLSDGRRHFAEDDAKWRRIGAIAAELGLVWGGIWRSYDPFHLEWHPGDDATISKDDLRRFLALAGPDGADYQRVWSLYPAPPEAR